MRLLNTKSKGLEILRRRPLPPYAIVSHRWGAESEEVLFTDIGVLERAKSKQKGFAKILGSCFQANQDKLNYVWLDTCCIDKSNSSELSEAINSMYKWYQQSEVCYAYLHDVSDRSEFVKSEWFLRGWTLQELIAPKKLRFYTKDWKFIGTREDLMDSIAEVTGISPEILRSGKIPPEITISQKMSWAAKRETTEVEDRAYSLLGILNVTLSPIYGIDNRAFEELQHKLIMEYSDQTLFSWYQTFTPAGDVERGDAIIASDVVPDSSPDQATEPVEGDTDSPLCTSTGLLALSPDQYKMSYEIPESEFRKKCVDSIGGDYGYDYRSHFSFSNNLVHISLPIKQMKGNIWKAVLRCSFEPPDGDEPQRPLVIYLKQIEPWKYTRAHLAPDEVEHDVQGFPGSLERLSDSELALEGYDLRNISVVGRHGDGESSSDDQPGAQPRGDDPAKEVDPIAELPRHPPGAKTTNIIICGEPGVATGRVINMIVGDTIVKPLTDYDREMMAVSIIDTTLQSKNIRIFYIIGLKDPYLELSIYYTALGHMHNLVEQVKEAGGIHLMLLCMVGSRVTRTVQSNYRLFHNFVCQAQVPMALAVTGLGKAKRMEDWWDKRKDDNDIRDMKPFDHVCITVLRGEDEAHETKYLESERMVHKLVVDFIERFETTATIETVTTETMAMTTTPTSDAFRPTDLDGWFVYMGKHTKELLMLGQKRSLKSEAIEKALKEKTNLSEAKATELAGRFFES